MEYWGNGGLGKNSNAPMLQCPNTLPLFVTFVVLRTGNDKPKHALTPAAEIEGSYGMQTKVE